MFHRLRLNLSVCFSEPLARVQGLTSSSSSWHGKPSMAVSGLIFACKPHFSLRPPLFHCFRKIRLSSVAAIDTLDEPVSFIEDEDNQGPHFSPGKSVSREESKLPQWKKLNSQDHGISTSKISKPTRKVLNGLKRKGYEVYLVGGCVRDLILKRTPKDFDIITTTQLREVSSFSTSARNFGRGLTYEIERPVGSDKNDFVRWRNCLQRDFTINGLIFDPYARIIYDYMGGIEDIRKAKVRTVIPASTSFQEDCGEFNKWSFNSTRILRAVRIAARLGFSFSRETAHFVKNLSSSILRLDKSRLLMEMNYMMAYGSAEASLRLLLKFGILEILLPIQAAYFVRNGFRRRDKRSNMLLSLFSKLDRLLAPNRPCHSSLWVGILAFHKALSDKPRDPFVVAAFGLAVHNGGDISEAISIAKNIKKSHDNSFHELSEPKNLENRTLINEVMDLATSVKSIMCQMKDEHFVSQAMSAYPQAPFSDLVFECVTMGTEKGFVAKQGSRIDYELLALGSLREIRHTFARVVFDTVYPIDRT
ncbi:putative DNA binding protein [Hibiscus syriacus]|uniref:DNA binding protein n=1 Tax=Hibiscus syriacus TaxID=106335 RepID=A0A6A2XL40_HIBSY|nr:putative DNA binding protein [Hibiscus syriacus]